MSSRAAFRRVSFMLLFVFVVIATLPLLACSKKSSPTAPVTASCGSGNVYWDTSVSRCRDHANGQFVKSECCGH